MPSGILLVDKPRGWTSHDVVATVRRLAGTRHVGHTGTLDPDASGILVLCLGRATRLARFFEALDKTYWAVMQLGIRTDTQDATGNVISRAPVPVLSRSHLDAVLQQFTGPIYQVPPMYSAVKYHGQRLYHLARQGQIVPRQARQIVVKRFEGLDQRGGSMTCAVTCSKGTYIRTLCDDVGSVLGCGAHLVHLQRCQVGPFCLRHAYTVSFLQQCAERGLLDQLLLSESDALHFLPTLVLDPQQYDAFQRQQGRGLSTIVHELSETLVPMSGYRLCSPTHETFAVLYCQSTAPVRWKVHYLERHETAVGVLS
jgi:tRNA pseudouridine55 synthase